MKINFTQHQLQQMETIEQAWDGDELKIKENNVKVWLTSNDNRPYNGNYTVETRINGVWHQINCYFD